MGLKRYVYALDLKEDEKIIAQYEQYHKKEHIWPEIVQGIKQCQIDRMDIYRVSNRLMMIVEADEKVEINEAFKKMADLQRQKEWALLMNSFQQKIPFAKPDEHWVLMHQIFEL
ncbi:MAG: L-rhamnose mutarotase [Bacteroidetes bacterium]|nr:L-rhamnose mutarotase [Bacteroidota bacterium]